MAPARRDLLVVDLRGLGPPLRAHARARGLTVSEATRLAVAAVVEAPRLDAEARQTDASASDKSIKLTIRLRTAVAVRLSESARACGLSQGAYLTTLLDDAPAPPLAVATELGRSTEQLAVVSADMNELIRTLARAGMLSGPVVDEWLRPLMADVRRHVGLASRLVSELRPARTGSGQRSGARVASQESHP